MAWEKFERTVRNPTIKIVARDGIEMGPEGRFSDSLPRACPNVFVFCCTMEFGIFPNPERSDYFNANSFIIIDEVEEFVQHVYRALLNVARDKDGNRLTLATHYSRIWHAPVRYLPRKPAKVDVEVSNLDLFVFQKDPKYSIEQEYRFVWAFFEVGSDEQVWVQKEPVDVPVVTTDGIADLPLPDTPTN